MKVSLQVAGTLKALHPGVRKDIRRALAYVDAGRKRDVRALKKTLAGYYRLRVGKYRIIFRFDPTTGEIRAEFLERRESVYTSFTHPEG